MEFGRKALRGESHGLYHIVPLLIRPIRRGVRCGKPSAVHFSIFLLLTVPRSHAAILTGFIFGQILKSCWLFVLGENSLEPFPLKVTLLQRLLCVGAFVPGSLPISCGGSLKISWVASVAG